MGVLDRVGKLSQVELAVADPVASLPRQVPMFLLAGGLGYLVSTTLTVVFTQWFGWTPFLAWFPAIGIAIICTWLMNRTWTFRSSDGRRFAEFSRYTAVSIVSAAINYLVYALTLLGLAKAGHDVRSSLMIILASALGSCVAAFVTFVLSRWYAFQSR